MWKPGDPAIFQMSKVSTDPGPRAKDVHPAEFGETYRYLVDKYWTVAEVLPNGDLVLVTRRGKRHVVAANDLRLRRPHWWERWLYRSRFPKLSDVARLQPGTPVPEKIRV